MTEGSPWARVSLRISCDVMTAQEVSTLVESSLPIPETSGATPWFTELGSDPAVPLDAQLGEAKELLMRSRDLLERIGRTERIDLVIGWTPRVPQDGLLIDSELLRLLAELDVQIFLDTYAD
jgi:hypothetical protein